MAPAQARATTRPGRDAAAGYEAPRSIYKSTALVQGNLRSLTRASVVSRHGGYLTSSMLCLRRWAPSQRPSAGPGALCKHGFVRSCGRTARVSGE